MFSKRSANNKHPKNFCSVPLAWAQDFLTMKDQMLKMKEFLVETECEKSQFCEATDMELYLKKDFRQVTGSCHARSALCTLLNLPTEDGDDTSGVITTLEEEAFPLCYFGEKLNIPVIVVLPKTTPFYRIQACKQFEYSNTRVLIQGDNSKEAEKIAFELAIKNNMYYRNDRARFIGYGSVGIEIFEQVPNLDIVVVPFDENNKTLAQSILMVMNVLKPSVQIVLAVYTTTASKSSQKTFQSIKSDSSLSTLSSESDCIVSIPKRLKQKSTSVTFQIETPSSSTASSSASIEIPYLPASSLTLDQIVPISTSLPETPTYISLQTSSLSTHISFPVSIQTGLFASSSSVPKLPQKSHSAPNLRTQEKDYINFKCIQLPIMDELMHTAIMKLFEKERCIVDKSSAISLAACFSNQQKFKKKRVVSLLTSSNVDILALPKYLEQELSNQGRLMLISVKIPNTQNCITDFCNCLTTMIVSIKKMICEREKITKVSKKFNVKIIILCETKILDQEQFEHFVNCIKLGYPNAEIYYNTK